MGFDCDFRYDLKVPKDKVKETKACFAEWIKILDDGDEYLDLYPFVDDEGSITFLEDDDQDSDIVGCLHNLYPHEEISKLIVFLNDHNIGVSGWLFTVYEAGQDAWYDIWKDGECVRSIGYEDTADVLMMCVNKNLI